MRQFKRTTSKTVSRDLRRFADYIEAADRAERTKAAERLNDWLDELLGEDAFGTEGQCDPRGDHRS